jgi:hypothetical protein
MSRFHFASVDSSAYAECSLRLGQILFALIQPSPAIEGNQIKSFLIEFSLTQYYFSNYSYPYLQTTFRSITRLFNK